MVNTKKNITSSRRNRTCAVARRCGLTVAALVLFGPASVFPAGEVAGQTRNGQQLVTAELISDAAGTERPFTVGIRFTVQPDWYLYWKNPGDAGLPIDVKWDLPPGWTAEEVRFPIPSKFVHEDIIAYGYKNETVLLATIIPHGSSKGPVKARLDWLVCRESCLRGGTMVSLDVPTSSSEERTRASNLIARFSSRLPETQEKSGVTLQSPRLSHDGERWTLQARLEGPKSESVRDFYPDVAQGIVIDFKTVVVRNGELTIQFIRQDNIVHSVGMRGLLVTTDSAFECEIPFQLPSQ